MAENTERRPYDEEYDAVEAAGRPILAVLAFMVKSSIAVRSSVSSRSHSLVPLPLVFPFVPS